MTYSHSNSHYRCGLQLAILLAVTSGTCGATLVPAPGEGPLMGHMVVTAARITPANVVAADLGSMTVTALRQEVVARHDDRRAEHIRF